LIIISDIASASTDKTIKIWKSSYQVDFSTKSIGTWKVNFLATMKNGTWFTGYNENLTAWYYDGIKTIQSNTTLGDTITALSNLNENLVIGFNSGLIQVFLNQITNGIVSQKVFNLTGAHTSPVIAFANSSNHFVSASSQDPNIFIWNVSTLNNSKITPNNSFTSPGKVLSMIFFK